MTEIRIEQFAALHAALDPARQDWQHDVLVSACVEVLTRREMTTSEVSRSVNRMWLTSAITEAQAEEALLRACELRLVDHVLGPASSSPKWRATDGGRRDTEQDRSWARRTMETFTASLSTYMELAEPVPTTDKLQKLANQLVEALAAGCAGIYSVDVSDIEGILRPLRYEIGKVHDHLRTSVSPRSLREPMLVAANAVMDPCDPFGNEVVHMLVVGSLLRGVLGRHDIPSQVNLDGVRILIDTSTLVDLADDHSVGHDQLCAAVRMVRQLGGRTIVGDHTIAELERLWEAADSQHPGRIRDSAGGTAVVAGASENPFVKAYASALTFAPDLTWPRFQVGRRNIESKLTQLGIEIWRCPDGNEEERDSIDRARRELTAALEHPTSRGRGRKAVDADSRSLAMLIRWRGTANDSFPARGYFLARDSVVERVYKSLSPEDDHRLVVNPEGLLLFASRLNGGDRSEAFQLAEMLGRSMVRESFLGLATGFTVEDALQLAELLCHDGRIDPLELRSALHVRLEESFDDHVDGRARAVGMEVIRRRGERRDARARRAEAQANTERAALERDREALTRQTEDQIQSIAQAADARVADAESKSADKERALQADADDRVDMLARIASSVGLSVIYIVVVALTWGFRGAPNTKGYLLGAVGLIVLILGSVRFCTNRQQGWIASVTGGLLTLLLAFLPSLVGM